jgi:hypothetical protein
MMIPKATVTKGLSLLSSSLRQITRSKLISSSRYFSSLHQPASPHSDALRGLVGADNVITDSFDLEKYSVDWTRVYKGGSVVCFPRTTDEVSKVLSYCRSNNIGVRNPNPNSNPNPNPNPNPNVLYYLTVTMDTTLNPNPTLRWFPKVATQV